MVLKCVGGSLPAVKESVALLLSLGSSLTTISLDFSVRRV